MIRVSVNLDDSVGDRFRAWCRGLGLSQREALTRLIAGAVAAGAAPGAPGGGLAAAPAVGLGAVVPASGSAEVARSRAKGGEKLDELLDRGLIEALEANPDAIGALDAKTLAQLAVARAPKAKATDESVSEQYMSLTAALGKVADGERLRREVQVEKQLRRRVEVELESMKAMYNVVSLRAGREAGDGWRSAFTGACRRWEQLVYDYVEDGVVRQLKVCGDDAEIPLPAMLTTRPQVSGGVVVGGDYGRRLRRAGAAAKKGAVETDLPEAALGGEEASDTEQEQEDKA